MSTPEKPTLAAVRPPKEEQVCPECACPVKWHTEKGCANQKHVACRRSRKSIEKKSGVRTKK